MPNTWFETVAEAQRRAKKRLPKSVYNALLAGSERGWSYQENLNSFVELGFDISMGVKRGEDALSAQVEKALVRQHAPGWGSLVVVSCTEGPSVVVVVSGPTMGFAGAHLGLMARTVEAAPKER